MDDTAEDRRAIQSAIRSVTMYPLSEYDGTMKSKDWNAIAKVPDKSDGGESETQWVFPEKFFDELPAVFADAPPLPGGGFIRVNRRPPPLQAIPTR